MTSTAKTTILRPKLYELLHRRFGEVRISDQGRKAQIHWVQEGQRRRLRVDVPGEYYRVCCPFCGDRRFRLWINHLWGWREGGLNLWLAWCFNETHCLREAQRRWQLYQEVFQGKVRKEEDPVLPGQPTPLRKPQWPGRVVPLNQLPLQSPARSWMQRRYPVEWLVQNYQVHYCLQAQPWCRPAQDRIIIPVWQDRQLAGWQARYVGDPPTDVPKYYTMPGMQRSRLLYNLDQARLQKHLVIVEGPTACWSVGPEAVGLFGKSCSFGQLALICGAAQTAPWQSIFILLDGNAAPEAQDIYDGLVGIDRPRILISLPPERQPGDYMRTELRQLLAQEAARHGIHFQI